jgi:hypothetical protein
MAIYNPSGLTLTNNTVGLKFTKVTDSSTDWSGITSNTYFFDVATQLPYYKNINNVIYDVFTGSTTIYGADLIISGGTQSIFSGNSSVELVRITQTGSGDAFVVEDSANADSSHFVINASGDTAIGLTQPLGGDKLSVSGNTGIYGTLRVTTISATTYQNLPNSGLRVIPIATANTTLATASNDYYMNVRCPHNVVANKVVCLFATTGSDSVRVGIYRGQDLTATLVGQGVVSGGLINTIQEFTITAVTGQTLSFSGGEWMVIAMAIGGTTTSPQSSTTIANNSLSWNNTTDSAAGGFPTNPRSKGGTNTSFTSFEIFP